MSDDKLDRVLDKVDELANNLHRMDKELAVVSESLQKHFSDDTRNIEIINSSLASIDSRLDENVTQLAIHIAGVNAAREQNNLLREEVHALNKKLEIQIDEHNRKLAELEKPAIVVKGLLWIIGAASTLLLVLGKFKGLL